MLTGPTGRGLVAELGAGARQQGATERTIALPHARVGGKRL